MHFAFIPYGKRSEVELLLRDMEAQKHEIIFRKDKQERKIWIQGQVRMMPLGVVEYVFPKEDLDAVIHTLISDGNKNRYQLPYYIIKLIRTMLRLKNIPEYKKEKKFLWIKEHVNIIPLGIREDGEITEPDNSPAAGFVHEAI